MICLKPVLKLEENMEYQELLKEISVLECRSQEKKASVYEIRELRNKKKLLNEELETVNKQLSIKEHNERTKGRIEELIG